MVDIQNQKKEIEKTSTQIIFNTYQILSPIIYQLYEQQFQKYFGSNLGGHLTNILDAFTNSKYYKCTVQQQENNKIELEKIESIAFKIKNEALKFIETPYFKNRGQNLQNVHLYSEVKKPLKEAYSTLKQLDIEIEQSIIDDLNNDYTDLAQKLDKGIQDTAEKLQIYNEFTNEMTYLVWAEGGYEKLKEIDSSDLLVFLEKYDDTGIQFNDQIQRNIASFLSKNGQNSRKIVSDFMNYIWANPKQKKRIFESKNYIKNTAILKLKVLSITPTSNQSRFQLSQEILIDQNGLITQNQQQQKQNYRLGFVRMGRLAKAYPVPNDIEFGQSEEKISRRQCMIRHNDQIGKYELICTAQINMTEFQCSCRFKYPLLEGTVIGIKDLIYFEIKKILPNSHEEKLQQKNVKQSQADQFNDLTNGFKDLTVSDVLQMEQQLLKYKEISQKEVDNFDPEQFSGKIHNNDKDLTEKRKNENDDNEDSEDDDDDKNSTSNSQQSIKNNKFQQEEYKQQQQFNQSRVQDPKQYNKKNEYQYFQNLLKELQELQKKKMQQYNQISLEVEFSRNQVTSPSMRKEYVYSKKPYILIAHQSIQQADIKIDCNQMNSNNQLILYPDDNNEWYICAPYQAEVTYQLKLSSEAKYKKEGSRPYQLQDNEIIQCQETRFQVIYDQKQK